MNIRELKLDEKNRWLKITDFENTFNVYSNADGQLVYNLNSTTLFMVDPSDMQQYICDHDMFWPLISYKIYGTARLWWLLMKLNCVDAKNAFDMKYAGDVVFYIPKEQANTIISRINEFEN